MATSAGVVLIVAQIHKRAASTPGHRLLTREGGSTVNQCVEKILNSGIEDIAVVVDEDQLEICAFLERFPVCIVINREPSADLKFLIKTGVQALPGFITGVIVAHCCTPLVDYDSYRVLERFHHTAPNYAVLPGYPFQDSFPALIPMRSFDATLEGALPENKQSWLASDANSSNDMYLTNL